MLSISLVYGQTLHYSFLHWDDYSLILTNPLVFDHTPATFRLLFTTFDPELYIPFTLLSFRMEHLLFGFRPEVFHLTNVGLHTLTSIAVLLLAWQWSKRIYVGILCALLFAVHPLNAETVSMVSARKDLLATLFFVVSLLLFSEYRRNGSRYSYLFSLFTASLGMLSKITAVSLPVILLLLHSRSKHAWRLRRYLDILPFFLLSMTFGVIGIFGKISRIVEISSPPPEVLWPTSTGFFLLKALLPIHLSAMYPFDSVITSEGALLMGGIMIAAIIIILTTWRHAQDLSFGLAFCIITLVPALLSLSKNIGMTLGQDHYMYLPLVGFLYAAGAGLIGIENTLRVHIPELILPFAIIIPLSFGILAHEQSRIWRDPLTLQRSVADDYPEIPQYQAALGNLLVEQGKAEEAVDLLEHAAERAPENLEVRSSLALAYALAGRPEVASKEMNYVLTHPPHSRTVLSTLSSWYAYHGDRALSKKFRRASYMRHASLITPHRLQYIDRIDELLLLAHEQ